MNKYQIVCIDVFTAVLTAVKEKIGEINEANKSVGSMVLLKIEEGEFKNRIDVEDNETGQTHTIGLSMTRQDYDDAIITAEDESNYINRIYPTLIFKIQENGDIIRNEGHKNLPCTPIEAGKFIGTKLEEVFKK
jgi:hypothetical protein